MGHLSIAEMRRDNAGHFPFRGERGVGEEAHQPYPPAAIDERDPRLSQIRSELARGVPILRLDRAGGAAIDAQRSDIPHRLSISRPACQAARIASPSAEA